MCFVYFLFPVHVDGYCVGNPVAWSRWEPEWDRQPLTNFNMKPLYCRACHIVEYIKCNIPIIWDFLQ